jgi:hypothetical protein
MTLNAKTAELIIERNVFLVTPQYATEKLDELTQAFTPYPKWCNVICMIHERAKKWGKI